jgi:hypothetical protein
MMEVNANSWNACQLGGIALLYRRSRTERMMQKNPKKRGAKCFTQLR